MKTEVLVPNLPESIADATLVAWHKKAGERVEKDENLVDLETDKVVLEVPAPQSGVIREILQDDGATVVSGQSLAVIDSEAESNTSADAGSSPQEESVPEQTTDKSTPLSPAVRRLVTEHNLDPENITGSGKQGRLTKSDVVKYIQAQEQASASNPGPESPADTAPTAAPRPAPVPAVKPVETSDGRPEQRVPMTRLRARVAERLIQAQQNAAMLTTFNEVNLDAVIRLREKFQSDFVDRHEVKLGFMSFFVRAVTESLKQFPIVNASVDEQDIIYHGYYDIGVAVASDRGLVVPVLRDADTLDFATIEKKIRDFGARAGSGELSYDDLTGGTFTITNGGVFGSMLSTPILNPPQSAILGMHSIQQRAVVIDGEIVARPMMYLALSYDHRIIDGREAVQFLVSIRDDLEDPSRLLLNL